MRFRFINVSIVSATNCGLTILAFLAFDEFLVISDGKAHTGCRRFWIFFRLNFDFIRICQSLGQPCHGLILYSALGLKISYKVLASVLVKDMLKWKTYVPTVWCHFRHKKLKILWKVIYSLTQKNESPVADNVNFHKSHLERQITYHR